MNRDNIGFDLSENSTKIGLFQGLVVSVISVLITFGVEMTKEQITAILVFSQYCFAVANMFIKEKRNA